MCWDVVLQIMELTYLLALELQFVYAGLLFLFSVSAQSLACRSLYKKPMELYTAVRQCHLVPVVQAGRVRWVLFHDSAVTMWGSVLHTNSRF